MYKKRFTFMLDENLIKEFRRRYGDTSLSSVINHLLWQKVRNKKMLKLEREQLLIKLEKINRELNVSGLKQEIETFLRYANLVYNNSIDDKKEEILGVLNTFFLMIFYEDLLKDYFRDSVKMGKISKLVLNKDDIPIVDMRW